MHVDHETVRGNGIRFDVLSGTLFVEVDDPREELEDCFTGFRGSADQRIEDLEKRRLFDRDVNKQDSRLGGIEVPEGS